MKAVQFSSPSTSSCLPGLSHYPYTVCRTAAAHTSPPSPISPWEAFHALLWNLFEFLSQGLLARLEFKLPPSCQIQVMWGSKRLEPQAPQSNTLGSSLKLTVTPILLQGWNQLGDRLDSWIDRKIKRLSLKRASRAFFVLERNISTVNGRTLNDPRTHELTKVTDVKASGRQPPRVLNPLLLPPLHSCLTNS